MFSSFSSINSVRSLLLWPDSARAWSSFQVPFKFGLPSLAIPSPAPNMKVAVVNSTILRIVESSPISTVSFCRRFENHVCTGYLLALQKVTILVKERNKHELRSHASPHSDGCVFPVVRRLRQEKDRFGLASAPRTGCCACSQYDSGS